MDASPRASATDSAGASTNGSGRRGVIELARVEVEDTIRLVQQEIQLAKIEIQDMLQSNLRESIFLGVTGVCGMLFFIMLLVFIALLIPERALAAGIQSAGFL